MSDQIGKFLAAEAEMNVPFDHAPQQLLEGKIQIEQLPQVLASAQKLRDSAARLRNAGDQIRKGQIGILAVLPYIIQSSLQVAIQLTSSGVQSRFQVGARMACLENFKELIKIMA